MLTCADVCGRMQEREAVLALDMQKMRSEFEAKDLANKKMHYAEKEVLGDYISIAEASRGLVSTHSGLVSSRGSSRFS